MTARRPPRPLPLRRAALPHTPVLHLPSPEGKGAGSGGRWGLVLGGGGVLGAAWLVGALSALERSRGVDARDAELIVGTSAGAVMGGLLGAGVPVDDLRAHQLGEPIADGALAGSSWVVERPALMPPSSGASRGRLTPASARMVTRNAARLRRMPPTAVLAGMLPAGRSTMPAVGLLMETVAPAGAWASHPGLRIVALDLVTGRRVMFGAPDAPPAGLAQAVLASCAIPGYFAPVTIDGVPYVDGGAWSSTNIDLLAGSGLDEIVVLAPMTSFSYDRPPDLRGRFERGWRARVTRRCLAEAAKAHRAGSGVTVLGPCAEDLRTIGSDLMATGRRRMVLEKSLQTSLAALNAPLRDAGNGGPLARAPVEAALDEALDEPLDEPMGRTPAAKKGH